MYYRDITFCGSDCIQHRCHRNINQNVIDHAAEIGLGIAVSDFSKDCVDYKGETKDDNQEETI